MKLEEATGAEVAVKLDEDLIGCGGHTFLHRGTTELANLRWVLVGSIPDMEIEKWEEVMDGKNGKYFCKNSSWDQRIALFIPKHSWRIL